MRGGIWSINTFEYMRVRFCTRGKVNECMHEFFFSSLKCSDLVYFVSACWFESVVRTRVLCDSIQSDSQLFS